VTSIAGPLLKKWRETRRLSQLELSTRSGVSAKHISYVETGRSRPSPDMVLHLCALLEVPFRDRNTILLSAGHAPRYADLAWDANEGSAVRQLVQVVLDANRYPVAAVDGYWNVVAANPAAYSLVKGVAPHLLVPPINLIRLTLHPDGLATRIVNLTEYATHIINRLRRVVTQRPDPELLGLIDEFAHLCYTDEIAVPEIVLPLILRLDEGEVRLISTIATFGSPQEVTLSELAIETLYPVDEASRVILEQALA
jgi:transcriptional regulator with XRE-family HTH domain